MAETAWDAFYDYVESNWLGNGKVAGGRHTFSAHHRYVKAFYRIARTCQTLGADVHEFVRIALATFEGGNGRYVLPTDVAAGDAIDRFQRYKQEYGSDAPALWATQVSQLTDIQCRLIPSQYADTQSVLMDPMLPFDPAFRLLYPRTWNEEVFACYGQAAWTAIQEDGLLRQFLRRIRGPELAELENRIGRFKDTLAEVR